VGEISVTDDWKEKHKDFGPVEKTVVEEVLCVLNRFFPSSEKGKQALRNLGVAFDIARSKIDLNAEGVSFRDMAKSVIDSYQEVCGADKTHGTDYVSIQKVQYERTGNPLHVWVALSQELEASDLPEWIKDYLDETCKNVLGIPAYVAGHDNLDGVKFYQEVANGFGFGGKADFYELEKWMAEADVAWTLDEVQEKRKRGEIESPKGQRGNLKSSEIVGKMVGKGYRTVEKMAESHREAQEYVDDAIKSSKNGKTD
jgi:hypothetical protein